MLKDVIVRSTGFYTPERVFTNAEFAAFLDTSDEWISERTGIKERHLAAPGENASDMAVHAARQALERAGLEAEDLDLIIVATVTPDTIFPATANWLQGKLENKHAWSFDINAGCSGYVYTLNVAYNILRTGQHRYALVMGAERMTALADMTKRETCVLFGDGAACLLLEAVDPADNPQGYGIRDFYLESDGTLADILMQDSGGSAKPPTFQTVLNHEHFIRMDGQAVFKNAVRRMYQSVTQVLEQVNLEPQEIDWFVGHQANARIIRSTQQRLKVPEEKVYMNVERYGNVTAVTIPSCLDELSEAGKLVPGSKVVLFTFGTGFTWGSVYLVWGGGA